MGAPTLLKMRRDIQLALRADRPAQTPPPPPPPPRAGFTGRACKQIPGLPASLHPMTGSYLREGGSGEGGAADTSPAPREAPGQQDALGPAHAFACQTTT